MLGPNLAIPHYVQHEALHRGKVPPRRMTTGRHIGPRSSSPISTEQNVVQHNAEPQPAPVYSVRLGHGHSITPELLVREGVLVPVVNAVAVASGVSVGVGVRVKPSKKKGP